MANGNGVLLYDRVGHIELDPGNGKFKSYEGLDFRFNINKLANGGVQDYADIAILGLSRNTVNALSTYLNANAQIEKPKMIKIYAGYKGTGEQLIFAGDMIWVRPSQPVDNWLNIKAQVAGWLRSSIVSATDNGKIPLKQLIESIGKSFDMDVAYRNDPILESNLEMTIAAFDCNGSFHDIINRVNTIHPYVRVRCEYNVSKKRYILYVYTFGTNAKVVGERIFKINYKTGLVGIPEFTYPGVKFKMLMNPYVRVMDDVEISSVMLPNAGGRFKIHNITFNGHFRGDNWYMECIGRKV